MRRTTAGMVGLVLASSALVTLSPSASSAPKSAASAAQSATPSDNLPDAASAKRSALRNAALKEVIAGRAKPEKRGESTVVKLGKKQVTAALRTVKGAAPAAAATVDQYVELSRETTDKIFVILVEFGNERDPNYPDQDTDPGTPGPVRFNGPLHNEIDKPAADDNSTIWQADYNQAHYQNLYFATGGKSESLKKWYQRQSSGRYSVNGIVTDWVKVRYNEARYGRSNGFPCAGIVCSNTWNLIQDAINQWVLSQHAQGHSDAQIAKDLRSFDRWDRNDYDNDGNFNESDGYIDHFQIVHSGGDQADGDPFQGEDAIWSHRWKAFQDRIGTAGPSFHKDGGTQIGSTGLWVADYTIQPENGGRDVFYHEYGHDLGLPDLYDTAGGVGGPMEWWSIMAQSRVSAPQDQGIGTRGADLGAWEKLQLGWLNYQKVVPGSGATVVDLGPHEYNTAKPQAAIVVLPKKKVTTDLGATAAGAKQWWSGQGDGLDSSMARQVTLPAGSATLSFQARYNIEDCGPDPCDYAYVEVDDGSGYHSIPGSITSSTEGNGIDGVSAGYVPATFSLSAYAGKTISLRIRYLTDGAAQGTDPTKPSGIFLDSISLVAGGQALLTDGAETTPNGWTLDGFSSVGAASVAEFDNYYIASWRTYTSYDKYLQTGPYNFGFLDVNPDKVEHFPYQDGLLITYWNTQYSDNNVSVHPGEGLILVVDAHPKPLYRSDGVPWRARVQLYDATFTKQKADGFQLHLNSVPSTIPGEPGVALFDDTRNYFDPVQLDHGVKVAKAGVKIRVINENGTSARIRIF